MSSLTALNPPPTFVQAKDGAGDPPVAVKSIAPLFTFEHVWLVITLDSVAAVQVGAFSTGLQVTGANTREPATVDNDVDVVAVPIYTVAFVAVNPPPDNTIDKFGVVLATHAVGFVKVTTIVPTLTHVLNGKLGAFAADIPAPVVVKRMWRLGFVKLTPVEADVITGAKETSLLFA
jgi:hypothetical protein